jgi:phosphatidylcholine synthase
MKLVSALVHCFTASGMIAVMLSVNAIWLGDARLAMLWLGAALLIDGLDGPLARWAKVSENLPNIDGAILDHVIDYMSYCVLPALMIYRFGLVPAGFELPIACLILVVSLYIFANRNAKTAENDFRGFPANWNIVVFYLIIFEPPLGFNLILCLFLSAMIFAPILIVHPLRVIAMRPYTIIFSVLWLSFALGYLMIPSLVENLMVNIGFTLVSLYFVMLCLWRSVRLPTGKA